ncbi:SnoaL-like domain-containing protein [Mycena indigotica]|uniref:SnoaL-like domain-containing protein n=1 Tax=Mycena indigotica TaxID=2126181 RepID=A0A8H6WGQ9_9AGAR|nr:SnoaL-like domain-containing protein [Mycena indigotica]KAF7316141.1 SnoaL-like domain-containing protein [Mycena indigotica]
MPDSDGDANNLKGKNALPLHALPAGWHPAHAVRNNGPDELAMHRFKLRELAEGWPMYRDAREWENFRSLFHPGAVVYTTWTGRIGLEEFIAVSQAGMDAGAHIMHRVHGCSVDIKPDARRAVVKMKATITQRFVLPGGIAVDAECDCRFCMFFARDPCQDTWGAVFVRHFYEKDRLVPVDPRRVPELDDARLAKLPEGYRFLAYCQEVCMGVKVKTDMPQMRGEAHDRLLAQCKAWLEGEDIEI